MMHILINIIRLITTSTSENNEITSNSPVPFVGGAVVEKLPVIFVGRTTDLVSIFSDDNIDH